MRLKEALLDAAKGDPHTLMNEIDFLINDKGYDLRRIFILGLKAGLSEDMIALTLFRMYGSDLVIFN